MSTKEARRRGMLPRTASSGVSEMFVGPDIRKEAADRFMSGDIHFGHAGLGSYNWYGNDQESKMTGGANMHASGLYGGYGAISDHINADFSLGAGTMAMLFIAGCFYLKSKGQ